MKCVLPNHSSARRVSHPLASVLGNALRLAPLVTAILFVAVTLDQSAEAQLGVLNRGRQRSGIKYNATVFTGLTRQLLRPLRLAKAAIEEQDFEQACLLIGELLDDDELKDSLVPEDQDWTYAVSLRQKALDLLGTLTDDQRSTYRDKYATRSSQLLEKAIEARDYRGIGFVSQRYLYTDAGLEATMLLGHHWLNQGRPEMSVNAFDSLLEIPRGQKLYDPELTLLSAIANALANQEEMAISRLKQLKKMEVQKVTFFQREISLHPDDQQPLEWLMSLIGDSPLKLNATVSQWLMWQGNPQRNSETGPGFPLFSPRWSSETLGEYETARELENWIDLMAKNQIPPIPKTNLLTVGDTIIIRTADKMMGIDAATGKRRWLFPGTEAKMDGSYSDSSKLPRATPQSIEVWPKDQRQQARQKIYYERVLQDTIFSQIASDGKQVFCIPNPGVATTASDWQRYRPDQFEAPTDLRKFNELCGINVAAEGALVWQVGGVSGGDESKLARTFFLGSPLPLDGSLYCICVQNQLVKLVVLDALNGSLQWEKELASTEGTVDFTKDAARRLAGATPSASDGIIVCPTGLNAIVAVDIGTRSLKWGFQLSKPKSNAYRRSRPHNKFGIAYENVWRDTSLKISDGSVVYTPINSKDLYCIDLRTGRSRWNIGHRKKKTLKQSNPVYVAAVNNGEIVVVAPDQLRGIAIETGEIAWKIEFGEHGTASGHGYAQGNHYYLPTTSKKLVQFDLREGKKSVSKVVDTQRVLGNLYPWNADIVSVGIDHVAAYPCDVASQQIFNIADTNEQALDSVKWKPHQRLAINAQLKMQQGDYPTAARLISEAYDLFPNSSYAGVLVEVLTEMIAIDFKQAEAIFQRYSGLFKQRDLDRLLRGKVNGLVKSQRYKEAFETLLEIADGVEFADRDTIKPGAAIDGSELVQLYTTDIDLSPTMSSINPSGVVEISRTSWLRWQLSQLASRVSIKSKMNLDQKMTKKDLVSVVAKHLEPFQQEDSEEFFQRLQLFPRDLIAPALIIETAQRLLESQKRIEAKNLLLDAWSDQGVATNLIARRKELLGQIAIDQQDAFAAMALFNQLEDESSDLNELNLAKLRQQAESLGEALDENIYDDRLYLKLAQNQSLLRGPRYNLGDVKWKPDVGEIGEAEIAPFGEGRHNCDVVETDIEELRKLVFRYDVARGGLRVHDSLGRQVRSVYLPLNGASDSVSSVLTGKIFLKNSVMLFCFGREMFALDWIEMVRGKDPLMWSIRLEKGGTSTRNVFGGPRSSGVCFLDGSELKCVDLFTGQTRWVRNQIPNPSTVKEGGDRITIWRDGSHFYETFDKLSGRRVTGGKITRSTNYTLTGHNQYHLLTIRTRSKSSKKESGTPDDPFAEEQEPYTTLKLEMFDFKKGEIAWERTFAFNTVFRQVDQNSIAVLKGNGNLSLLDLATGEIKFEQQIEGLKQISVSQLSVVPMAQGYICVVGVSPEPKSKVKLDENTEVDLSQLKSPGWFKSSYIFAVERETGKSLWSGPVRVEQFGLLEGTPYDSPLLMLIRRANYHSKSDGANRKQRIQVAMLDVKTGQLKSNHLFKELVGNEPRLQLICRPGKEYQSIKSDQSNQESEDSNQRLELLIASQRYSIQLTDSAESSEVSAPAVLSNDNSTIKLEDELDNFAVDEDSKLVVDLEPVAQLAKEAYDAMLEHGKLEAKLFEQERKQRQQQR